MLNLYLIYDECTGCLIYTGDCSMKNTKRIKTEILIYGDEESDIKKLFFNSATFQGPLHGAR